MKYIREYSHYELINEKITFQDILLYLGLLYGIHTAYDSYSIYKEVKNLYSIANSTTNYPKGDEKSFIDSLRQDIISQVKKSPLFDKYGKEYILDSLKNITIKITEPTGKYLFSNTAAASFIKLENIEKIVKNDLTFTFSNFTSSKKNIILINKNSIHENDLAKIITHEIYHYVDVLLGNNTFISSNLNLSQFIDDRLDDKKYVKIKISLIIGENPKKLSNDGKELIDDILSDLTDKKIKYLSDPSEMFVRWKVFKLSMVKKGYIKSTNSEVNEDILYKYISETQVDIFDIQFLFILNWSKIEELDKLIN